MPPMIPTAEIGHPDRSAVLNSVNNVGAAAEGLDIGRPIRPIPPVFVHLADPSGQLVTEDDQAAFVRSDNLRQLLGRAIVGDQPLPPGRRRRVDVLGRIGGRHPLLDRGLDLRLPNRPPRLALLSHGEIAMPPLVEVGVKFALQKADEVDDGVEPWRLARRRQPDIRYPDDRRFDPAGPGRCSARVGDDGAGTGEQGHGNEVYGAALGLSRGLDPTGPKLAEWFERQRRRLVPVVLDQPHIRLGPVLGLGPRRVRDAGRTGVTVGSPRRLVGEAVDGSIHDLVDVRHRPFSAARAAAIVRRA